MRLIERPGVLHFFDGRRVVSVRGDDASRRAIRRVLGAGPPAAEHPAADTGGMPCAAADARELLTRLNLLDTATDTAAETAAGTATDTEGTADASPAAIGARFASAATAGWVGPRLAGERLRATQVHVWDDTDALRQALSASGLRCTTLTGADRIAGLDPAASIVAVAAADQQPLARLRAANAACLRHGVRWLPLGGYDGANIQVGPLMVPGQTACAECLLRRLAANVEYAGLYDDVAGAPSAPTPHALRAWSHSMAALILLRWLAGRDAALPGLLLTLAPDELAMRQARVHRVPRCPACAGPDFVTAPAPWEVARDH